jgi:outer membrane protein TolC
MRRVVGMRWALPLVGSLAALVAAFGSHARLSAQAAPGGRTLSLLEALELAERQNPGYRQATNQLEQNDIDRRAQWLSVLPRPTIQVLTTGMSWNLRRTGVDNFGNPIPNPEPRMVQSSQSQQSARVGLTLDFGRLLQFRQLSVQAEARETTVSSELQQLRSRVRLAFLDAQERQVTVDLENELLAVRRTSHETATSLFALARRERLDVLDAELEVLAQEEVVRQSHASLSNALLALRNLIGDPALVISAVEPLTLRSVDPATFNEESVVRAALESNVRIRQAQANLEVARREVNVSRTQWLPTLSFNVNTGRTELDRGGGGAFLQPNPASDWDRNISFDLSFPDLGRHFELQNTTRGRQLTVRNQEEALRQVRLDIEQEVRSVLVSLDADHASLALQERRVEIAQQRLDGQMERYRLGQGTFLDLQNASQAAATVQRTLLQRRYQFERSLVNLEQTLGMTLERIVQLGG